jgi:hypothetical protein
VHIPTTDQRELCLARYTQAKPDLKLLLDRLQPPSKITAVQASSL